MCYRRILNPSGLKVGFLGALHLLPCGCGDVTLRHHTARQRGVTTAGESPGASGASVWEGPQQIPSHLLMETGTFFPCVLSEAVLLRARSGVRWHRPCRGWMLRAERGQLLAPRGAAEEERCTMCYSPSCCDLVLQCNPFCFLAAC